MNWNEALEHMFLNPGTEVRTGDILFRADKNFGLQFKGVVGDAETPWLNLTPQSLATVNQPWITLNQYFFEPHNKHSGKKHTENLDPRYATKEQLNTICECFADFIAETAEILPIPKQQREFLEQKVSRIK